MLEGSVILRFARYGLLALVGIIVDRLLVVDIGYICFYVIRIEHASFRPSPSDLTDYPEYGFL